MKPAEISEIRNNFNVFISAKWDKTTKEYDLFNYEAIHNFNKTFLNKTIYVRKSNIEVLLCNVVYSLKSK
jgi:hypothetical protein